MTARTVVRRKALTIAEILDLPAVVPLCPTVARALDQADSTIYQLAAEGRLPFKTFRIGRRLHARTVDLCDFLGLADFLKNDDSAKVAASAPSVENDPSPTGSIQSNKNGAGVAAPSAVRKVSTSS